MPAMKKRDLVVHYDENRGLVICYSVETDKTKAIREAGFGLEVPVSTYKSVSSDEAERLLGSGIFSLLDLHSESPIGIRDYRDLEQAASNHEGDELRSAAARGDARSMYLLALDIFADGVRLKSESHLDEAEALLQSSAAQSFEEAVTYLREHWQRDKASALRGMR